MTPSESIEFEKEFTQRLTIHKNLGQEVVVTTVDKVKLCLMKNRDCLATKNAWLNPLSLLIALITTLVAADFRGFIVSKEVWQAIYIVSSALTLCWLCVTAQRAWVARNRGGIDEIVEQLKRHTGDLSTDTSPASISQ